MSPFLVDTAEKTRLCDISEEDIENFKKKTNRQIRINEIIKKHSSKVRQIIYNTLDSIFFQNFAKGQFPEVVVYYTLAS